MPSVCGPSSPTELRYSDGPDTVLICSLRGFADAQRAGGPAVPYYRPQQVPADHPSWVATSRLPSSSNSSRRGRSASCPGVGLVGADRRRIRLHAEATFGVQRPEHGPHAGVAAWQLTARLRRIYQFTSLVFAIVAVTCGTCLAQSWPPWSDDLFGRRWEDRNEPRRARPPKDFSERKDGQKGGDIRSGGARPDIVPVAPPVVACPLTFPTNSMVIDTGGRKLYYVLPDKKAYA